MDSTCLALFFALTTQCAMSAVTAAAHRKPQNGCTEVDIRHQCLPGQVGGKCVRACVRACDKRDNHITPTPTPPHPHTPTHAHTHSRTLRTLNVRLRPVHCNRRERHRLDYGTAVGSLGTTSRPSGTRGYGQHRATAQLFPDGGWPAINGSLEVLQRTKRTKSRP